MRFLSALLLLSLFLPFSVMAQDTTLPYFDGIPVMNGFMMTPDDVTLFDKPEGRIAEVFIWCETSCPSEQSVRNYYTKALSGLGWVTQNDGVYTKPPYHLQLDVYRDTETTGTVVHFWSFEKKS